MIFVDLYVIATTVLFVILPLLYFIYYRKFRYFIFDQRDKVTKGKTSRGKCPPFFPNGKIYVLKSIDHHLLLYTNAHIYIYMYTYTQMRSNITCLI